MFSILIVIFSVKFINYFINNINYNKNNNIEARPKRHVCAEDVPSTEAGPQRHVCASGRQSKCHVYVGVYQAQRQQLKCYMSPHGFSLIVIIIF